MAAKRYRCPDCGKTVTLGEHFCLVNGTGKVPPDTESDNEIPQPGLLKKIGVTLLVATLSGGMLWPFLGIHALFVGLVILAIIAIMLSVSIRSKNNGGEYYKKLLASVGGQKDVAKRLIEAEEKKHPSMTRAQCVRRVHDRLEYEHHR